VLGVINASPGDLCTGVRPRWSRRPLRLSRRHSAASLSTRRSSARPQRWFPGRWLGHAAALRPEPGTAMAQVIEHAERSAGTTPETRHPILQRRRWRLPDRTRGCAASLACPCKDNSLPGFFTYRQEVRPFTRQAGGAGGETSPAGGDAMRSAPAREIATPGECASPSTTWPTGVISTASFALPRGTKLQELLDLPDDSSAERRTRSRLYRYLAERGESVRSIRRPRSPG